MTAELNKLPLEVEQSAAREYWEGFLDALPYLFSIIPYGLILGTLAADRGLSSGEAMLQSALFFAGASQIVMLELYGAQTPIWVISLAIFAVNFRMVLYSAALGRKLEPLSKPRMAGVLFFLQDILFAVGMKRAETQKLSFGFMFMHGLVLYIIWVVFTGVGVVFGNFIPDTKAVGFDLLVPIYFLFLVMGFRRRPNFIVIFLCSFLMSVTVYVIFGSPYHIAAGGVFGMGVAAALAKPKEAGHVE